MADNPQDVNDDPARQTTDFDSESPSLYPKDALISATGVTKHSARRWNPLKCTKILFPFTPFPFEVHPMAAVAHFTWTRLLIRFFFAILLVFATYNPFGDPAGHYSLWGWIVGNLHDFSWEAFKADAPLKVLAGIILIIGWGMYLRATWRSMGAIGVTLALAFFAALLWVLVDTGLLSLERGAATTTIFLIILSAILALGMTWSMIRRRLSGQVDVTEEDSGDS